MAKKTKRRLELNDFRPVSRIERTAGRIVKVLIRNSYTPRHRRALLLELIKQATERLAQIKE